MKNAFNAWLWGLKVVARSPLALAALAAVVAALLFAAYRWLSFPMVSAVYLLVLGSLWALAELAILVALLAATARTACEVAEAGGPSVGLRSIFRFRIRSWLRAAGFAVVACAIVLGFQFLFGLIEGYSVEIASFLTMQQEKPISPETIDSIIDWVENVLWVLISGFMVSFLLVLVRQGWHAAVRSEPRLFANSFWRPPLFTTLATILFFGGMAYLVANWEPKVPAGYLDFAQVIVRNGLALLLLNAGWLVWLLSLARLDGAAEGTPELASQASDS